MQTYQRIAKVLQHTPGGHRILPLARAARRLFSPWVHEKIARLTEVERAFHPPSPNNFVEIFVPRARDRQACLDEMHGITAPLNDADGALLSYLTEFSESRAELMTDEIFEELIQWSLARRKRQFLSGVNHATKLLAAFSRGLGQPMVKVIQSERPELLEAFCSVPEELKRVLRINLHLSPLELPGLVQAIASNQELSVARLEVARVSARMTSPPQFPVLLLYAPPRSECDVEQWVAEWKAWLEPTLPMSALGDAPAEFADVWRRGCSITEGFRLYKRYLQILDRLDTVYDARRGYAYAL